MRTPALLVLAILASLSCATKKHVSSEVGAVNEKVTALSAEVERTQARTTRNEGRIEEVDRKAEAGIASARRSADGALARAAGAERLAQGKLLYTLTLTSDEVKFAFAGADLNEDARQVLAETLAPVISENRGVFLEIEGHTDSTGPDSYNRRLGEQRALSVRDYLHDELGIALSRMAVISYGSSRPIVDNKTRASRALNRRVVINVLE